MINLTFQYLDLINLILVLKNLKYFININS